MTLLAGQTPTAAELNQLAPHASQVTGNTNASGYLTVTHGAGFAPSAVVVTPHAPSGGSPIFTSAIVDTIGGTTFRVRAIDGIGNAVIASTSITLSYVCHR